MEHIESLLIKNGLLFAFLFVGVIMWLSYQISHRLLNNKIPGVALAVIVV